MRRVCMILAFVTAARSASHQVHKVQLSEAEADLFGARCLDGSAYAFYVSGGPASKQDWVVYLEGGGECISAEDCTKRARTGGDMGSSIGLPKSIDEAGVSDGITDSRAKKNPHFASFGTVYLPYCSGDDWLATMHTACDPWKSNCTAAAPDSTAPFRDGAKLHFAGHNNFVAAMNRTLFAATTMLRSVLLSGGSAGGQGAYAHADWLADTLKERGSSAHTLANPQYGVFTPTTTFHDWKNGKVTPPSLPYPSSGNPTGVPPWLANVQTFVPTRCVAALNEDQKSGPFGTLLCALTPRMAQTIETPLFLSLNLFDAWLTGVEEVCCGPFGGASKVGPTAAADPHFAYLMALTAPSVRAAVHNATDANVIQPNTAKRNGAFVPPCIDHPMQWHEADAPKMNGCNHADAVSAWFFGHVNGGKDWEGVTVPTCERLLISRVDTAKELAALACNKGQIKN